jgi:predicted GNAT superfamily acetyltransferase
MPLGEEITIRPFETESDFLACEALQRETWGKDLAEVVTASLAKIVQKIGGIAAGAFDAKGEMLGFVFGFTGYQGGRPVHWSHMLAVKQQARDLGLGRKLKLYQRDTLLKMGVKEVFWTYDPLVAKNAHLNFNCFGVEATEYVPRMYGPGEDSELFRGLGTDRFIVVWRIASDRAAKAIAGQHAFDAELFSASTLAVGRSVEADEHSAPRKSEFSRQPSVRVEIPPDIHAVRAVSAEAAAQWRQMTRGAFQFYLSNGYEVAGFYRDKTTGRCFYCLQVKR